MPFIVDDEIKERVLKYLTLLIRNNGVVNRNANSNIALAKSFLDESGITSELFECNGVQTLLTKKTQFILNSHVDVVPGIEEQTTPVIRGDYLYGRGSCDALGCAAAMIVVIEELHKKGIPVTLMLVSDEEDGGINGTKHILENVYTQTERDRVKFVIVGEPTHNFGMNVAEKGILRLKVIAKGEKGHASKHEPEKNAIINAAAVIDAINNSHFTTVKTDLYENAITLNPVIIKGGIASNIIPDEVEITYNIRFAYGSSAEDIISYFTSLQNQINISHEVIKVRPASISDTNNPYFKLLHNIAKQPEKNICHESSDYSYFCEHNIPGVVYGVKGGDWHKDTEYVDINSIYEYVEHLMNFFLQIYGNGELNNN